MARPQKLKFLSRKVSIQALEERLKRDPDHLDKDAFAKILGRLLHQAVDAGLLKREITDLLVEAHTSAGLQVQRAFVEDAVSSAVDQIEAAARELHGNDGSRVPADETEGARAAVTTTNDQGGADGTAHEQTRTTLAQPERPRSEAASPWPQDGPGLEAANGEPSLEMPSWHRDEDVGSTQAPNTDAGLDKFVDEELVKYGAVERRVDGRLVFATEADASRYQSATGNFCMYLRKGTG